MEISLNTINNFQTDVIKTFDADKVAESGKTPQERDRLRYSLKNVCPNLQKTY